MEVLKVNFPAIINDNSDTYFKYLEGIIASVDDDACLQLIYGDKGINIRIAPSVPQAFDNILEVIKRLHTTFSIQVDFSKSMKNSQNIWFRLDF